MKSKLIRLLFSSALLFVLFGCEKKVSTITYEGGTAPVLTASRSGNIPLSFVNKDQEAVKLTWTNPNYQFTTGGTSQDVSYQLEIDTTGANFTNPNKKVLSFSKDLSISLSQNDLNDYLLNTLQLTTGVSHNIEMRVRATLGTALPLYSNVVKFTATPYAIPPKVAPPSSNKLFMVGSATPGGWSNPVPVPSQEFTRVSPTLYELTVSIVAGGSYLFLPVNGDWSAKYGGVGSANNSNNVNGDDFKAGGSDLLAPSVSGTYKIQVDFQRGKFTLTKL
jgi:starch-binding outer membrane protein SusE/F